MEWIKFPRRVPSGVLGANPYDAVHDQLAQARMLLLGMGLDETQGQTLLPEANAKLLTADLVFAPEPLSVDMNVLRPSLLPGLLESHATQSQPEKWRPGSV